MNKYMLVAALAAPSFVLVSCSNTPESLTEDVSDLQEELASVLDECNKDNADSKAEKVEKLVGKIKKANEELGKMMKEDEEGVKKLFANEKVMKHAFESKARLSEAKFKVLNANCYGSSALQKAISGEF